jgi:hypothetical protein
MNRILSYLEFINESRRSQEIPLNGKSVLDVIKEYAPWYDVYNVKTPLYRGLQDIQADALLVDPSKSKRDMNRFSALFTTLFDNMDSWKQYPKRSRSLICTTSSTYAEQFGVCYRVIPLKNISIAVSPQNDFWYCFRKKLNSINVDFDDLTDLSGKFINKLFVKFNHIGLIKPTYENIKKVFTMFDEYKESDLFPDIKENLGSTKLMDYLEKILDPDANGFKLFKYNNNTTLIKRTMGREVWFSEPALLVYEHTLQEAIKSEQKYK